MEGTYPQVAWAFDLLQGMNDVVDFFVLLGTARTDVRGEECVRMKTMIINLSQIDAGNSLRHPFGDDPADPSAVRYPNRLSDPETTHIVRLSQQWITVRRE